MRLKKRTKFINYAVDGSPQKKYIIRTNISRFIYLGILLIIILFILYSLFNRVFYIKGDGLINFSQFTIRAFNDIIIDSLYISEGDAVKKGGKLLLKRLLARNISSEWKDSGHKYEEQVVRTEREIKLKYSEISYLRNLNNALQTNNLDSEELRSLELDSSIEENRTQIFKNEQKIKKLQNEIYILRQYKQELERLNQPEKLPDFSSETAFLDTFTVMSPMDGEIAEVYKYENEMAVKGDEIVSISSLNDMRIKGYFDQKYIKYIHVDKLVDIKFPHGVKSKGIVKNFYFSTIPLPPEFQKKYEPTRRSIIADIYPLEGEKEKWAKFHMLTVELILNRN